MSVPVTLRLKPETKARVDYEAAQKKITVSTFLSQIIERHYAESDNISGKVDSILNETQQLEGLLSVMMLFEREALATLLGRTDVGTMTPEQKEQARENKQRAHDALEKMTNVAAKKVMEGESVWGSIDTKEE